MDEALSGKALPRGEAVSLRQISHPRSHVVIRVEQHQSSLCRLWVLSVAWQRLARLPIPSGLTQDLNPRATKMESPRLRHASSLRSRPKSERCRVVDCGLRLTASYASLMPPSNPIDTWNKVTAESKKPIGERALGLVAA